MVCSQTFDLIVSSAPTVARVPAAGEPPRPAGGDWATGGRRWGLICPGKRRRPPGLPRHVADLRRGRLAGPGAGADSHTPGSVREVRRDGLHDLPIALTILTGRIR